MKKYWELRPQWSLIGHHINPLNFPSPGFLPITGSAFHQLAEDKACSKGCLETFQNLFECFQASFEGLLDWDSVMDCQGAQGQ